jgi:hypothetical protein
MMKHRSLFFSLGLAALLGLSSGPAKAGSLTISVTGGGHTYTFMGGNNSITVNTGTLNSDLTGTGYTFSDLSGFSNFGGSDSTGGFVRATGDVTRSGGTGGPPRWL